MKKDRQSLLSNEPFKIGDNPYKAYLVLKQPQLDEPEKAQLVHQLNESTVQAKDQQYQFSGVFANKNSNEDIYKAVFRDLISHFLAGESHMIQILGERHSGKATLGIGNMRNPGLVLLIMQEIFNFIEEKFLENNITIKMSVFEYDETGFKDLLVLDSQPFMPVFQNGQNQLLGIPEVIIDNYLLGMKILRIAMVNLINKEQNILSQKFVDRHKRTNLIIELKAEISPNDDIKEQVIISKLKIVKFSGTFEFGQIYKTMADLTTKRRKHVDVPFKSVELLDYFRDYLLNQKQTVFVCINSDSVESVKFGSLIGQIMNKSQFLTFSIYQQNAQLKDIMSNQYESLNLFHKEFCQYNESKKERGKIIFSILIGMANLYKAMLKLFDQASEIKYKLNCLYSQVISFHCSKYNNIINTEDCKEFYLAKIQLYAIEQVQTVESTCQTLAIELLNDLFLKNQQLIKLRKEMIQFGKQFNKYQQLSQYDLQRLNNTHQLVTKLLIIFDQRLGYNILNQIDLKYYQMFDNVLDIALLYKEDVQIQNQDAQNLAQTQNVKKQTNMNTTKFFKPTLPSKKEPPQRQRFTDVVQQLFHDENTKEYYSAKSVFGLTKINDQPQMRQTVKSELFDKLQSRQTNNIKAIVLEEQKYRFFRSTGVGFIKNSYRSGSLRAHSQMLPRIVQFESVDHTNQNQQF
ncbi:unnamed protein product [Paramecium octaurelia]|uniref:Kinesin motor domain-containing protein n=1 Tax=Paramecium octaurelia TaxID=43137 RepID=A0A8S1VLG8_PAROT|nr:unnamed protein product [Paramecium octaurelia]